MEVAIAAIISGLFTLAALWFKDYLDNRKSISTGETTSPGQTSYGSKNIDTVVPPENEKLHYEKPVAPIKNIDNSKKKVSIKVATAIHFLLLGLFVASVVSVGFCWLYDTESIMFSGPIISIIGIVTAWWAHKEDNKVAIFYGLSAPTVSLLCLILIASLSWGPSQAREPISLIGGVYSIFLLFVVIVTFVKSPNKANPADARTSRG